MKALLLKDYMKLVYTEIEKPQPGPADLLVRVKACAICGSDVHGLDGSTGRRIPPLVMGHEASGIIESVGAGVKNFNVGDRITFDSTIYCGSCDYCRMGLVNLCDQRRVLGVSCGDYRQNGALAEYVVIPEQIAYRLPDQVTFEQAAMVEPVSIALHAVKRSSLRLNATAVVVGSGMIGLFVIQLLRIAGCKMIIAVDLDPKKLDLALEYGATHTLLAGEGDFINEIDSLTAGKGADSAFEVVGVAQSLKTALSSLKKGGSLTLVGNLQPQVELPLQQVVTREISIKGSCASAGEYPDCLDLIARGALNVNGMISAVAPLAEGAGWFERLYRKEPGLMKVILKP